MICLHLQEKDASSAIKSHRVLQGGQGQGCLPFLCRVHSISLSAPTLIKMGKHHLCLSAKGSRPPVSAGNSSLSPHTFPYIDAAHLSKDDAVQTLLQVIELRTKLQGVMKPLSITVLSGGSQLKGCLPVRRMSSGCRGTQLQVHTCSAASGT